MPPLPLQLFFHARVHLQNLILQLYMYATVMEHGETQEEAVKDAMTFI